MARGSSLFELHTLIINTEGGPWQYFLSRVHTMCENPNFKASAPPAPPPHEKVLLSTVFCIHCSFDAYLQYIPIRPGDSHFFCHIYWGISVWQEHCTHGSHYSSTWVCLASQSQSSHTHPPPVWQIYVLIMWKVKILVGLFHYFYTSDSPLGEGSFLLH